MTHKRLLEFAQEFMRQQLKIIRVKNVDYSAGDAELDGLRNFRLSAERAGVRELQSWYIQLTKHMTAIEKYVKTGRVESEAIRGRFLDAANYLILGLALIEENDECRSRDERATENTIRRSSSRASTRDTCTETTRRTSSGGGSRRGRSSRRRGS